MKIYHYIWYLKTKDNFHNKNIINLKTKHNKLYIKLLISFQKNLSKVMYT